LTLVEHALCPLDAGQSLCENLVFETGYYYSDKNRHQKKAAVKVTCPGGLSSRRTSAGTILFVHCETSSQCDGRGECRNREVSKNKKG